MPRPGNSSAAVISITESVLARTRQRGWSLSAAHQPAHGRRPATAAAVVAANTEGGLTGLPPGAAGHWWQRQRPLPAPMVRPGGLAAPVMQQAQGGALAVAAAAAAGSNGTAQQCQCRHHRHRQHQRRPGGQRPMPAPTALPGGLAAPVMQQAQGGALAVAVAASSTAAGLNGAAGQPSRSRRKGGCWRPHGS